MMIWIDNGIFDDIDDNGINEVNGAVLVVIIGQTCISSYRYCVLFVSTYYADIILVSVRFL